MPEMDKKFQASTINEAKCIGLYSLFESASLEKTHSRVIEEFYDYNPDVVVVFKGYWSLAQRILNATIRELKGKNPDVIFIYWSLDDPFFYTHDMPTNHVENFDIIFTCCEDSIKVYNDEYDIPAFLLYPAFDKTMWRHVPYSDDLKIDFSIIGSAYSDGTRYDRVKIAKNIISRGYSVEIYGPADQWLNKAQGESPHITNGDPSLKNNYVCNSSLDVIHNLYCKTKVNFNSHIINAYRYLNSRVFEIMGCGAFMLCDNVSGIDETFIKNEHVVLYENEDDFLDKFIYYKNNVEARNNICLSAMSHVLAKHTFTNRYYEMMDVLNNENAWRK